MNIQSIFLREPRLEDEDNFIETMRKSEQFHFPWGKSATTPQEFKEYIERYQQLNQKSFLLCDQENHILGVFNVNDIVRRLFQNAYLGYYAVAEYAGKGYMNQGLKLLLKKAFTELGLHRLEAQIEPENINSIKLVKKNGFRKEGVARRVLNIFDKWRDCEIWAITYEDWIAQTTPQEFSTSGGKQWEMSI